MKPLIIPVFIPNQGCPNVCIFCNQKKITGMTDLPGRDDVRRVIEEGTKGDGSLFYRKKSDKTVPFFPFFLLLSTSHKETPVSRKLLFTEGVLQDLI